MKDFQARGYIFESVIWKLLERFGYIGVNSTQLQGRGASHQIDAYGFLKIPTPFIYPIRLLCEVKCYGNSIGLDKMRNFLGVIKDISENYIVGLDGERSTPDRFTDVGCYFSASSYSLPAQNYAWAHNIFIVSFKDIPTLSPIVELIRTFVQDHYNEIRYKTKSEVVNDFWRAFSEGYTNELMRDDFSTTNMAIGVLDGIYVNVNKNSPKKGRKIPHFKAQKNNPSLKALVQLMPLGYFLSASFYNFHP